MKINCNSFFDGNFDHLNLNDFYLKNKDKIPDTKIPSFIQSVLDSLNKNTYGGYGEDRKDIWKGTYLDKTKGYIHLGIDINVPSNTPIRCPFDCALTNVFVDKDTNIGWGTRLMLMTEHCPYCLVLGHLKPDLITILGDGFFKKKGELIGYVGTWPENGNTFQHLHVQCIKLENAKNFDGFEEDLSDNPNPFDVEFL